MTEAGRKSNLARDHMLCSERLEELKKYASFVRPDRNDYSASKLWSEPPSVLLRAQRDTGNWCRQSTGRGNPRLMYAPNKEEEEWDQPVIVR